MWFSILIVGSGRMREVLDQLIAGEDFDKVLVEHQLNKYELLAALRQEVLTYKKEFDLNQREQLKSIYLKFYSMVDLTGQKVVFVSDTHFASKYENTEYFPVVLDFCRNQGIFYLFHGGDIGAGMVDSHKEYQSPIKQINHILDVYPEDKHIRQYVLGGNHDTKYLKHGFDILKILSTEKRNVFPLGYLQSYFTVFGYPISFEHHSKIRLQYRLVEFPFAITGHAHKSRFADDFIKLPTLSDDIHRKKDAEGVPGFIVMETVPYGVRFDLNFSRYSFDDLDPVKEECYTYQFTKKK